MKKRVSIGLTITLLASGTTSAFASEHHPHPKQIKNVEFQSMNAPTTIEDMIKTYTNASVKVNYKDGSVKKTPLKYNQLFLSKKKDKIVDNKGEMIAAGTPIDVNGDPIIDRSVPDQPTPYVSDVPDSNSFITINGKSYIISHYEYESIDNAGEELGGLPASMTLTQVDRLNMAAGQKDQSKGKIDSRYVPASMEGLVIGEDLEQADAYGNTANPDKIANPDNLTYSEDMNTLFIGEDSDMHTNNFVWAYNVKTKKLSRILSVPVGAEATGLRAVESIENSRYLLSNYQHPGEKLGKKDITAVDRDALEKAMRDSIGIQETGGVGYVSGLPSNEGPQHKKQ